MTPAGPGPVGNGAVPFGPRNTREVYGHNGAQLEFLEAHRAGRLHHAWLITGPRGIGKATLAWRFTKFLLHAATASEDDPQGGGGVRSLDVPGDHAVARRIAAGSELTVMGIERSRSPKSGRMRRIIPVENVRELQSFFSLTSADGLPLVAVVDSPDEMERHAANAMLKLLEEPPNNAYLFLVSHSPARLLPTIRSRCRRLTCRPLGAGDMTKALEQLELEDAGDNHALINLSEGSVGTAVELAEGEGLQLHARIVELFAGAPGIDRTRMQKLAGGFEGGTPEIDFEFGMKMMALSVARLARAGASGGANPIASGEGESKLFGRLAAKPQAARVWAELHGRFLRAAAESLLTNINPASAIIDMCLEFDRAARRSVA